MSKKLLREMLIKEFKALKKPEPVVKVIQPIEPKPEPFRWEPIDPEASKTVVRSNPELTSLAAQYMQARNIGDDDLAGYIFLQISLLD